MNSKVKIALLVIIFLAVLAIVGSSLTSTYYSDSETVEGNTFQAADSWQTD